MREGCPPPGQVRAARGGGGLRLMEGKGLVPVVPGAAGPPSPPSPASCSGAETPRPRLLPSLPRQPPV